MMIPEICCPRMLRRYFTASSRMSAFSNFEYPVACCANTKIMLLLAMLDKELLHCMCMMFRSLVYFLFRFRFATCTGELQLQLKKDNGTHRG